MTGDAAAQRTHMAKILVLEEVEENEPTTIEPATDADQLQEEGAKEVYVAIKSHFRREVVAKSVSVAGLGTELERAQNDVDELLRSRTERKVGGMHLQEIQVSLGISAEGSIGFATAGVEASITLVYAKV